MVYLDVLSCLLGIFFFFNWKGAVEIETAFVRKKKKQPQLFSFIRGVCCGMVIF